MFEQAKAVMEDYLKAFMVNPLPPIVEAPGSGVAFRPEGEHNVIAVGVDTEFKSVPFVDWMVAVGKALLQQFGSDMAVLHFGPESEADDACRRMAEDLHYVADLAAIYQCYLQNPVEAYCIYDEAVVQKDEPSLHPIAVALGLSHPRGLESMGFDRRAHAEVFEEAEFFKAVVTRKRPDLSLLVGLQNVWQKQVRSGVTLALEGGVVRFSKGSAA